jgi:hypothetical protein
VTSRGAALALSLAAAAAALAGGGCQSRQTALTVTFPDGGCETVTDLGCVNYLLFTVNDSTGFSSHCVKVDKRLDNLCDVAALADGHQLFQLSPDTRLPIGLTGMRVFPATGCDLQACAPRIIFSGETMSGRLGDYVGRDIPLPLAVRQSCGPSEEFFFLPPGTTCAQLCGSASQVVCDGIQGGCLCRSL